MIITDEMKVALDLIENTNESLYITGKAGTGKTTLLRYVVSSIKKSFVVAAPTGVAAVNAGGVTLHSLLNIPFGCLTEKTPIGGLVPSKRKLIQTLEVIIIDEVSMVRPDVMDFVDRKLRVYRQCNQPFGGVQIIMFGDLYQLPPVVKAEEWDILRNIYKGQYFFFAQVFASMKFKVIELTNIFRQTDQRFIEILNNIRKYEIFPEDIDDLAECRNTGAGTDFESTAIHVCTHRADVQRINSALLGTPTFVSKAVIKDRFNENAAPCDAELKLRVGARIMMLTNNKEAGYCNGSLGYVSNIELDSAGTPKVAVELDNGVVTEVAPYTWEAFEYEVDKKQMVNKKTVGSCTQLPLSLAWAITIHKSQGLTFDNIIIHARKAFCPGQVYVALSRCKTLDGLKLDSFITKKAIMPDSDLIKFESLLQQSNGEFTPVVYGLLTL